MIAVGVAYSATTRPFEGGESVTNTELLNDLIQQSGLKKVFIADKLGMTPVGLHNCITGKSEFKASHIRTLCDLLRIEDLKLKEAVFFAPFVATSATE